MRHLILATMIASTLALIPYNPGYNPYPPQPTNLEYYIQQINQLTLQLNNASQANAQLQTQVFQLTQQLQWCRNGGIIGGGIGGGLGSGIGLLGSAAPIASS